MSNMDLVKEVYAAFARRDMNAILARLSADVVWGEPENPFNPAGGTRHGHAGFLEWARIGRDAEDIEVLTPQRFLANEDSVAVVGHMRCRAKSTGQVYESDFVHLVVCRDGKIVLFQEFFDTYAAGEAFRMIAFNTRPEDRSNHPEQLPDGCPKHQCVTLFGAGTTLNVTGAPEQPPVADTPPLPVLAVPPEDPPPSATIDPPAPALPPVTTGPSGRALPAPPHPASAARKKTVRTQQAVLSDIEQVMTASRSSGEAISKFEAKGESAPCVGTSQIVDGYSQNSDS